MDHGRVSDANSSWVGLNELLAAPYIVDEADEYNDSYD